MRVLRFSTLGLLVLITLVSAGLAWWVQPSKVTAVANFLVQDRPESLVYTLEEPSEQAIKRHRETQQALVTSPQVLNVALQNPVMQKIKWLRQVEDPLDWLSDNLETEYEGDSELLAIRLTGREEQATDLVAIVDAVCRAYEQEVLDAKRLEQHKIRDALELTASRLGEEVRDALKKLQSLRKGLGEDAPEVVMLDRDIKRKFVVLDDLVSRIDQRKIELAAKPQISWTQHAFIEQD